MRIVSALLVGLPVALGGCLVSCPDVECVDTLTVILSRVLDDPGSYTLTLTGDVDAECSFDIDDEGMTDGGDCDGTLFVYPDRNVPTVELQVSEGAYELTLERGDEVVADEALEQVWQDQFPGGRLCRSACATGLASLELSVVAD